MVTTTEAPPASETIDTLAAQDFALIPPESIRAAKENRHFADDEDFRALVESVRDYGVLVPLLVRSVTGGADEYELIAGERRWTAAMQLKLDAVPAFVLDYEEDADRLTVMWSENAMRRELSTMDKARHVGALVDLGLSQRDVAEKLGISQPQVSKLAALLKLPPAAHSWVDAGELSQDEAVRLASLPATEVKKLVPNNAKTPPQPWRISEAYENVKTQAAMVQGREKAKELGLKVVKTDGHMSDRSRENSTCRFPRVSTDAYATLAHVDRKAHEAEKCHAVVIETRGDKPILVPCCTDPAAHPRPKGWKPAGAKGGAPKKAARWTDWAERRKRKDAALQLHLPFFQPVAREALAVALKHEEDDYCLDFAAYALLETTQPVETAAQLLDLPNKKNSLVEDLLSPDPGTVDGFAVLYAMALAGGLDALAGEISDIAESEGKKREAWQQNDVGPTKAFLRHLDGLIEGVPTYEALVEAVKEGKPLGMPEAGGHEAPEASTESILTEIIHTVTFKSKAGKVHRTCTCGNRGASSARVLALQVAREHIARAHGGVGAVQDELGAT